MEKKRIGELRHEFLMEFNIDISNDRIREYEDMGLFSVPRNTDSQQREFSEADTKKVFRVLALAEIGCSPKWIDKDNYVRGRIYSVEKLLKFLKGE